MSSDSSSPGLRLPGLIHFREGSAPLAVAPKAFGAARQAHASLEYLRRHAGLGQDCSAKQYRLQLHVATNDPSSATAATRCADCNCDGPPPFAAAHRVLFALDRAGLIGVRPRPYHLMAFAIGALRYPCSTALKPRRYCSRK